MQLTTTQVSLIAAGIALAAPAITYSANARLDRARWARERRAEAYIDALATLGQIANYISQHLAEPVIVLPAEQWRLFQARLEAFASDRVISIRDQFLAAWSDYRKARASLEGLRDSPGSDADKHRRDHERKMERSLHITGEQYAALIVQVRTELQERRKLPRRYGRRHAQADATSA
jgi:hypothetical protein